VRETHVKFNAVWTGATRPPSVGSALYQQVEESQHGAGNGKHSYNWKENMLQTEFCNVQG